MLCIYIFPVPVFLFNDRQEVSSVAGSLVLVSFIRVKDNLNKYL